MVSIPFGLFGLRLLGVGIGFGSVALTMRLIAVLSPNLLFPFIGDGSTERWVAYPIMLWLIGFGWYLMNENNNVKWNT